MTAQRIDNKKKKTQREYRNKTTATTTQAISIKQQHTFFHVYIESISVMQHVTQIMRNVSVNGESS